MDTAIESLKVESLKINSPIGHLFIEATAEGLLSLRLNNQKTKDLDSHFNKKAATKLILWQKNTLIEPQNISTGVIPILTETKKQLGEYFAGDRKVFNLPLILNGTDFEVQVWKKLLEIPYGETLSYRELAAGIGRPGASRAVGSANGRNQIPLIIPCHRVIASNGSLGGYSGGLISKEVLLNHEKSVFKKKNEIIL